jgi:hypothetical protein
VWQINDNWVIAKSGLFANLGGTLQVPIDQLRGIRWLSGSDAAMCGSLGRL